MIKFDKLEHCKKFVSNPGNKMHPVQHGEVKDDGTIRLVVDRYENTDEIIDSFRASSDLNNIIARIEAGDVSLLNQRQTFYGDVVGMPKTYAEMLDLIHRGEQFFEKLPVEVKEKYNNDFNQFFADFDNAMKDLMPSQKEEVQEIVEEKTE